MLQLQLVSFAAVVRISVATATWLLSQSHMFFIMEVAAIRADEAMATAIFVPFSVLMKLSPLQINQHSTDTEW